MPNGMKKRSNSNSYPLTDPTNARHSPTTDSNPNLWNGSQADQRQWLNAMIRSADGDYVFNSLVATGAVPITSRGYTAVFGPQHALEHLAGENIGTFKNPNMRDREDLNALRTASTTTPSATTPAHGGYIAPTISADQTDGSAAPTATKSASILQDALGELADQYKIAPDAILEADLRYLNHFIDAIANYRLADIWKNKSGKSGRRFVTLMLEEMADSGVSLTTEDTHGARMRALLQGGLECAEFDAFLTVTGAYEEMNATLETPIPEATRAHEYKKLVCNISDKIATAMLLNISMIESKAIARGKNPAKDG